MIITNNKVIQLCWGFQEGQDCKRKQDEKPRALETQTGYDEDLVEKLFDVLALSRADVFGALALSITVS